MAVSAGALNVDVTDIAFSLETDLRNKTMKRTTLFAVAVAVSFCFSNMLAFAQQDRTPAQQDRASAQERGGLDVAAGNLDPKTTGPNLRVSELIGMDIQNLQGDKVGKIEDVVLNVQTAKVNYAAVSYGGFLGIGDDLFAVPFEAFKVGKQRGEDEYLLVLDVTEEQLDGAEGFDKDNWPNFADQKFTSELDRRYKVERRSRAADRRSGAAERRNRDRDVDVDVETNRDGADIEVKRERDSDNS